MNVTELEQLIPVFLTWDSSKKVAFASHKLLELTGYNAKEIKQANVDTLLGPERPETWLVQKWGSRIPVRVREAMLSENTFVYAIEDLSIKQRMQTLLDEQDDILNALFAAQNVLMEGVVITENPSLKILRASDGFQHLVQCDSVGRQVTEFLHENGRSLFENRLMTAENMRNMRAETLIMKKNGEKTPVTVSWTALHLGTGPCLIFIFRDITRRKSYEKALRKEFDGICFSKGNVIFDVNKECCDLFGYTADELIGTSIERFLGPRSKSDVLKKREEGFAHAYVFEGLRKDGTTFLLQVKGRSFYFEGDRVRVTIMRPLVGADSSDGSLGLEFVNRNDS